MSDTITTRQLGRSDVPAVLELMRASLGEPPLLQRTPELFAWKHFDNPFGESIALVAEADDRIVGLRTMMRWDLTTPDGETIRAVRPVDTATHPDYQRRGIFRRLTEEAIDLARDGGIGLIFNTPNEKSGAGYLSMGWKGIGPVGVMIRPSWRVVAGGKAEPKAVEGFLRDPAPAWPFAAVDRAPLGLRTPRTPEYAMWRFAGHPAARYHQVEAGGSVAVVRPNVRNGRRELIVVDVYGDRPASALRRAARRARTDYCATWFTPGTPERAAALRSGYLPVPGVAPLTLMGLPLGDLGVDWAKPSSWDLAISDLELL